MTSQPSPRRHPRPWLWAAAALLWPLVVFVDLVVPWQGRYQAIGNDFIHVYYVYKVYLLDYLSRGQLPLWSPAEAAGFPFFSNPNTQAFYPLNLPLALFYRAASGYSSYDHQLFTLLGVGLFCLGMFRWLGQLVPNPRAALFAACAMAVSLRIGDNLRFPNAIHAVAWYPWMLYGMTAMVQADRWRQRAAAGSLLVFSSICLITAGYPYMLYYGLFLFPPYALVLVCRPAALPPELRTRTRSSLVGRLALAGAAGLSAIVICAPYLLKVAQLLDAAHHRGGGDLAFAMEYPFGWRDSVASFVFPAAARLSGVYYFGMVGPLLIGHFLVELGLRRGVRGLVGLLFLWFLLISAVSYGAESGLFMLLWDHLPGFSRLRVWGRLSIVLLPVLGWLLAHAYDAFDETLMRSRPGRTLAILGGLYLAVLAVQLGLAAAGTGEWRIAEEGPRLLAMGALAFGVLALLVVVGAGTRPRGPDPRWLALGLLLAVAGADLRSMASIPDTVSVAPRRRVRLDVPSVLDRAFDTPRQDDGSTLRLTWGAPDGADRLSPHFGVGVVPDWHLDRYVRFRERAAADGASFRSLMGLTDGRRVFLSARIDHEGVGSFLEDAAGFPGAAHRLAYSGDCLRLAVESREHGFVSFVDNWDPDWQATVDGRRVALERLFGTFKAVPVAAGRHRVEMCYRPWPQIGSWLAPGVVPHVDPLAEP